MFKILVIIFLILIIIWCSSKKRKNLSTNQEGFAANSERVLYLLLEAPGFDVPELNSTKEIMDPAVAKKYFDKVVVVANSAKYKGSGDVDILNNQWDNPLVKNLGLPVEKWVFVCCSSKVIPAKNLMNMLLKDFNDISGFVVDAEADADFPGTIKDFVAVFKNQSINKYKYGIIGGLRKDIPPQNKYGMVFDKYFSEAYTEGTLPIEFYAKGNTSGDTTCVATGQSMVTQFWKAILDRLGSNEAVVPTVCGSGNCQENMYGTMCFDERLSPKQIGDIIANNTTSRQGFGIWYGTGQQFDCQPTSGCLTKDETSCVGACEWSPYKTNPTTKKKGVCYGNTDKTWGCAKNW